MRQKSTLTFAVSASLTMIALTLAVRIASAEPAPPLRAVVVEYVASSRSQAWEPIQAGALSTVIDHGGPSLWVQTREDGYGQNQIAKFAGNNMRLLQSAPVLDSRRMVVGWRRVWQYSGSYSNGQFTFQATSQVGVPTIRSTRLYIR